MSDIAAEAGLGRVTIYGHFTSRLGHWSASARNAPSDRGLLCNLTRHVDAS
jgi:hypothetical protein